MKMTLQELYELYGEDLPDWLCLDHDQKIIPVHVDEDGNIETDENSMPFVNGMACPVDECGMVFYESNGDEGEDN